MKRVAALVLLLTLLSGCGSGEAVGDQPVQRLLIVSLPGVAWRDIEDGALPTLARFAADAAVGDVATRVGRAPADTVGAYLTIGSGTRAIAPIWDRGVALHADETYRGVRAAEILERRLGRVPDGIVYLAVGAARDRNEHSAFGADVGTLGDELDEAGVRRAVIANADEVEGIAFDPPLDGAYGREAATALMGSDGRVPEGNVARALLADDPAAPFGRRLDLPIVLDALDDVRTVTADGDQVAVLVEASDLTRVTSYRGRVTPAQQRALRASSLAAADELLAALLDRVDPERDAVLVLAPTAPGGGPALGVAALQAPGVERGVLRSATTRRDGYVQLADVTPTVLALFGLEPPDAVEGRAFRVVSDDSGGRTANLADAADAAAFRDRAVAVVSILFGVAVGLLAIAVVAQDRLGAWSRRSVRAAALAVLGALPATFIAGAVNASSAAPYVAVVVIVAAIVGAGAWWADNAVPGIGALVALGVIIVVIAGDIVLGASMQVNTVFGYSVAVAGRFAGLGNLAFAILSSATLLAGVLLADRFGRGGVYAAIALLGLVVLVDGLPVLGADVGGVLAMVPAFGVTTLVLLRYRVRWQHLIGLGVAAVATVLTFAFVDLARPAGSRTHLARLAQHVLDQRWGPFFSTLTRRWQASFGGAELAAWATIALVGLTVAGYVALVATRRIGRGAGVRPHDPPAVAAVAGVGLLALIGPVANDSSFAVPGAMTFVVVPVVAQRVIGMVPSR